MDTAEVSCFVTDHKQKAAAIATLIHFPYCQLLDADIKEGMENEKQWG